MAAFLNRSISRREFSLMSLSLIGSGLLAGCGGLIAGGGRSGGSMTKLSGALNLPGALDPTTLEAVGGGGVGTLGASSFSVEVQSHIPSLAMVWDQASGRLVLMGIMDPDATDHRLDAES